MILDQLVGKALIWAFDDTENEQWILIFSDYSTIVVQEFAPVDISVVEALLNDKLESSQKIIALAQMMQEKVTADAARPNAPQAPVEVHTGAGTPSGDDPAG